MANRWERMPAVTDFILGGLQNTVDSDCSHEIKRSLLLGRKTMANLDRLLKSRNSPLLTKIHWVKGMVFPVVMGSCENWTMKKAEHQRIDVFKLWCWRRLLRVLLDSKIIPVDLKGNQPWIFIGRTDTEAETLILWPPDQEKWLIGKDPDAQKDWRQEDGDNRGWDGWMASPTQCTWVWANYER